ncbi:THUMP domain-containing class I SAM-dependent RNA methyltransferase [Pseudoprimorskyibacter insulae]|uniref:Ribosomal RNA large subunit methyltransferase L n=1 Tax=Pseudoprimorskyibacter insulae TaxID=1695997 RepID=A0A2R8B108_9RHOB|nr:RNA methyltransferase [Pseudoprimorskyibacter insulae]SPF81956.1 Ribosomal RNA large subunit methyltransferase L [Pseudoprimorskyibacter insulae]
MQSTDPFEIFLVAPPGLEPVLLDEVRACGFPNPKAEAGGVSFMGHWPDVWAANLKLRGAGRVLARIGSFRAFHLAQLDKRSRKFPWGDVLRPDVPVAVEVTCQKSKIYHAGAAAQRVENAITETLGAPIASDAPVRLKVRIDDNLVTFSVDTSGESLHKRGHKLGVAKAPMRETLAALFLRACGYTGQEPVLDPMCGSGTFPIEAAEIALGLYPGRTRSFGFEHLATYDPDAWQAMRSAGTVGQTDLRFYGSDRNAGGVEASRANAERAGVDGITSFAQLDVRDLKRPDGPPGLVIVNPPYGARIGNKRLLYAVHASMGDALKAGFSGWRVGIVTTEGGLARATGLPLRPPGPYVPHGGLKVRLYHTDPLA